MAYNECAEDEEDNFRLYVAAFLPQLNYYEYKRITDAERQQGSLLFEDELRELIKVEDIELAEIRQKEQELADAELHSLSFVEYLNTQHLFDKMFENDDEGKALLAIGTEEVEEFYTDFKTQFIEYCQQVFNIGQKHYQLRNEEIEQFTRSTEAAKKQNQQESIEFMEAFIETKQDLFVKVKLLQTQLDTDEIDEHAYVEKVQQYLTQFDQIVHDTWKNLMRLELQLVERLEEVNQNFEHNLTEMINSFIEECQAVFTNIRDKETIYSENMSEAANQYLTMSNIGDVEVPEVLKTIMYDKENLVNAVGATHDMHLQVIDDREDVLISRARTWLDTFIQNLYDDEIKRNRYKILEVSHFLDIQREEFDEMTTLPPPPVDPDDIIEVD